MLFNSLQLSFTYAFYYLDRVDFIDMLCVNKDNSEMHCGGKCHLMKVAKSNDTKDDKAPFKATSFKEIILYVVAQTNIGLLRTTIKKTEINLFTNLYAYLACTKLDHPPQV